LIERHERCLDFICATILFFPNPDLPQPEIAETPGQSFVARRFGPDDIHILKTGLPIKPKVRQVLPEESETFPKEENRDQREDDDRDQSVATEERLDPLLDQAV
jgi:hypothetical protein